MSLHVVLLSLVVGLITAACASPVPNAARDSCDLNRPPNSITNGNYEHLIPPPRLDRQHILSAGSFVKIRCDPGFRVSGSAQLQCGTDGNLWQDASCEDIDECQITSSDVNDADYPAYSFSSSQPEEPSIAYPPSYPCTAPARCVNDQGSFECQCDGSAQCSPDFQRCGEVAIPEFGKIVEISTVHVVFQCYEGHRLVGSDRRICVGGSWDGTYPVCEVVTCDALPSLLTNGWSNIQNITYVYGSVVIYECNGGYRLTSGSGRRMCMVRSDMTTYWTGQTPCCTVISCPDMQIANGQALFSESTGIGSQVKFRCFAGYELRGSRARVCQTNGQWSGTTTTCNDPDNFCPAPEIPPMAVLIDYNGHRIEPGTVITYGCNFGFDLIGTNQMICTYTGKWSSKAPKCLAKWEYDDARLVGQQLGQSAHNYSNEYPAPEYDEDRGRNSGLLYAASMVDDVRGDELDVYFLIDVSRSVRNGDPPIYLDAIDFAKAYVDKVGVSKDINTGVRYAVIAYASEAIVTLHLNAGTTVTQVHDALNDTERVVDDPDNTLGDGTATASALQMVYDEVIQIGLKHGRDDSRKLLFLLTDGRSNMNGPPELEAARLKSDWNVDITCIGIGSEASIRELNRIASEPQHDHVSHLNTHNLIDLIATFTATEADYTACGESKGPKNVNSTVADDVWPWQAGIYTHNNDLDGLPSFFCGGTLIQPSDGSRPKWILTAAHCFDQDKYYPDRSNHRKLLVVMGITERIQKDYNEFSNREQRREVNRLIIHEKYDPTILPKYDYDIALLELKEPFDLGPFVRTVCLPPSSNWSTLLTTGDEMNTFATGWGKMSFEDEENTYSNVLKQLALPIRSRDECKIKDWDINGNLTTRMFCAGYADGTLDTCGGDSGGPLVRKWHLGNGIDGESTRSDKWYQVGIISWGIQCSKGYGYFTHVPHLVNWIDRKINE